jgi:preprotein translocase subunit YajC
VDLLIILLPLVAVIFLISRSNKNRQRAAMQMRDAMEPGTGVRTAGGMYAQIKEVREDTLVVEPAGAPSVHMIFAKSHVIAILEADEYERIVTGEEPDDDTPAVPDDASSLVEDEPAGDGDAGDRVELGKSDAEADADDEVEAAAEPRESGRRDEGDGSRS